MEYINETNAFQLSSEEFESLMAEQGAGKQAVQAEKKGDGETRILGKPPIDLGALSNEQKAHLTQNIATIENTKRTFMIMQTLLNETASRYSVAFEEEKNDEVVLLYDTMNHLTIQSQKLEDWIFELEKFLSIDGSLPSKGIRFDLGALTVITLLAIFDFYQYAYHYSCLTGTVPMETFTIKEIKERLDAADKEDHRWLLKSFAKVFPAEIAEAFVLKDLTPAIEELVKAGFIELRADEEGKNVPAIYGFSNELNRLKQATFFAVSKLSMRVSGVNKDGKVGFETLQFIRDGTGLTMFGVTGDKGVFMRLSQEDWGTLLERLIPGKRTTDQPTVRMRVDKPAFCIKCGLPNARDSKFCSKCGAKMP